MTSRLEEAFRVASALPPAEQDALAATIFAEIESEAAWEQRFGATADQLMRLADEAGAEHRAGRTEPLDPERP